jgi:flavodoxin
MEILLYIICSIFSILTITIVVKINKLKNIKYKAPEILFDKKILTVYYSNMRNTKKIAQNLHSIVGGDIKEIELIEKYPNNIFKMSNVVRKQIKDNYFPNIDNIDISEYDIIFIGSPVWNFSISLPMKSFLKNNDFKNKTLIPFFTCSGGASKNKVIREISELTDTKNVKKPLIMFEDGIIFTNEQIINWLNNL